MIIIFFTFALLLAAREGETVKKSPALSRAVVIEHD